MAAYTYNGVLNLTQTKYYCSCPSNLPYKPFMYWNVITADDTIPVITHGYANEQTSVKQIKQIIINAIEYRLIHVSTKEEDDMYMRKTMIKLDELLTLY